MYSMDSDIGKQVVCVCVCVSGETLISLGASSV